MSVFTFWWVPIVIGAIVTEAETEQGRMAKLPKLVVPQGLGVNIHFTGAPAKDLDMLHAAGFRFVRMDFVWEAVERQKDVYDFKAYDQLTEALKKCGIRALYILDYSNKLYESERSVRTEEGRRAFTKFAAAAAERFRGRGILWELWNEPNISFWTPQPSLDDYMALAKRVFPAIRRADPDAICVAPATSGIPLDFLEGCFKQGLLDLVDAITVHPYRQSPPETVADDYLRLRALIARYKPDRPDFPILSAEWGYSAAWNGYNEARQGLYLPRQFLTNLSLGIPLSIWYDWHDDGPDPKEPEHHFGTVTLDYKPKPAYLAMQRLIQALDGLGFVKRLSSAPEDHLLLFSDEKRRVIAAWTTGAPHETTVAGLRLALIGEPQYVAVPADAAGIVTETAWDVVTKSPGVRGGTGPGKPLAPEFVVRVRNPFPERIKVKLVAATSEGLEGGFRGSNCFTLEPGKGREARWTGELHRRDQPNPSVLVSVDIGGNRCQQTVRFHLLNPVKLRVAPYRGRVMAFVDHEVGEVFGGKLTAKVGEAKCSVRLQMAGEPVRLDVRSSPRSSSPPDTLVEPSHFGVSLPLAWPTERDRIQLRLLEGREVVSETGTLRLVPLPVNADNAVAFNDGDKAVSAEFDLRPMDSTPPSAPAASGLRFTYNYGKGWKFVRIAPKSECAVEGKPSEMGVWVRGDGSKNLLRMRFVDQNGRTFQPEFGKLDFSGWRYLTARLDDPRVGHWGGTGDESKIAYPIRVDTFILVDSRQEPTKGEIELAGLCLLYRE